MRILRVLLMSLAAAFWGVAAVFAALPDATSDSDSFAQANAKYQSGDFKEAYTLYKKLVDGPDGGPAVYYNLGNAAFKIGLKGEALLYYRRAQRWIPRDADLKWNMGVLQSVLADRSPSADQALPVYITAKLLRQVSAQELALVLSGGLGLLVLAALLKLVWPPAGRRLKLLIGLCWFLTLTIAVVFALKWAFEMRRESVVVLEREVTARYGPSAKETRAFILHEGAEAKVLDEVKDWVYVGLDEKTVGWIPKNSCRII